MSYFGVITCPKCGQKVTLTPEEVVSNQKGHHFFCRRCQIENLLPVDFVFKTPVGKDLPLSEAIGGQKSGSLWGSIKKLLSKLP